MKKLLLLFTLLLSVSLASCAQPPRDPEVILPAFFASVNEWIKKPSKENALDACQFLSKEALQVYPGKGGKDCSLALESAFGSEELAKIELSKEGFWKTLDGRKFRLQPVTVFTRADGAISSDSAAFLIQRENWAIQSLAGLSFTVLVPGQDLAPSPEEMALLASKS